MGSAGDWGRIVCSLGEADGGKWELLPSCMCQSSIVLHGLKMAAAAASSKVTKFQPYFSFYFIFFILWKQLGFPASKSHDGEIKWGASTVRNSM